MIFAARRSVCLFWFSVSLSAVPASTSLAQLEPPPRLPPGIISSTQEPPLADPPIVPVKGSLPIPPTQPLLPMAPGGFPPTPRVRLWVHAPAVSSRGQELVYRLYLRNDSPAAAHHVRVRAKMPQGAEVVNSTPTASPKQTDMVWELNTLAAKATKELTLTLKPPQDAATLELCAWVSFEHGQCVQTRLDQPGVTITKELPKQTVLFDMLVGRLRVTNPGKVPVTNVRVVETLQEGLEFAEVIPEKLRAGAGLAYTTNAQRTQRTWILGMLRPGQTRRLQYRLISKQVGTFAVETQLQATGIDQSKPAQLTVLEPKLGLEVTGPQTSFLQTPATYRMVVTNLGTVTLNNVRVSAQLPLESEPSGWSEGGQYFPRERQVQWIITQMRPSEQRGLNLKLTAQREGTKKLQVTVRGDRGLEQTGAMPTQFSGVAATSWQVDWSPQVAQVGQAITYNIQVTNSGSAPASNVRIQAELPDAVEYTAAEPAPKVSRGLVEFPNQNIAPGKTVSFRLTVTATRSDQAAFRFKMAADHLDSREPLTRVSSVTIQPR